MINKMGNYPIFDSPTTVYKLNGFSLQELLSEFWKKIQDCIEDVNIAMELMKWIKEVGLPQEVQDELQRMYEDGRLASIINEKIFGELDQRVKDNKTNIDNLTKTVSNNKTEIEDKVEADKLIINNSIKTLDVNINKKIDSVFINAKYPPVPLVGITEQDTDIGVKLQAMNDSLPLLGASNNIRTGKIFIPTGAYSLVTPVNFSRGVMVEGEGYSSQYANKTTFNYGTVIRLKQESGYAFGFRGEQLQGSGNTLKGIRFTGGKGQTCYGVNLADIFMMFIEDCSFEHLDVDRAVRTEGQCNGVKIMNCNFTLIGKKWSYGRAIDFSACADSNVIDCFVEGCGGNGITLGSANCKVIDSFIDINDVGISITGPNNTIDGCTIKLQNRSGIIIQSPTTLGTLIKNCTIRDNNVTGGDVENINECWSDIRVQGGTFTISDCNFGNETTNIMLGTATVLSGVLSGNVKVNGNQAFIKDFGAKLRNSVLINDVYNMYATNVTELPTPNRVQCGRIVMINDGMGNRKVYVCIQKVNTYEWKEL